ncbi:MAG: SH3 domain-containing protein, partial [Pseudolabrys sp.]|nr:SH3 domain-containing protein [Pseudolabrys sp.]
MTLLRLTVSAASLLALTAAAVAKPVTLASETNLRAAPGTKSDVVGLMPRGETIEVGACDAGWCKVTWNGKEGFAIARNVGMASPPRTVAARGPRYAGDDYVPVSPPGVVYEDDAPVVYGPPAYYYYPYRGPYWGGGWGWRGGW